MSMHLGKQGEYSLDAPWLSLRDQTRTPWGTGVSDRARGLVNDFREAATRYFAAIRARHPHESEYIQVNARFEDIYHNKDGAASIVKRA
jgi:hypothetical protein